jgi:hypothetical protein
MCGSSQALEDGHARMYSRHPSPRIWPVGASQLRTLVISLTHPSIRQTRMLQHPTPKKKVWGGEGISVASHLREKLDLITIVNTSFKPIFVWGMSDERVPPTHRDLMFVATDPTWGAPSVCRLSTGSTLRQFFPGSARHQVLSRA